MKISNSLFFAALIFASNVVFAKSQKGDEGQDKHALQRITENMVSEKLQASKAATHRGFGLDLIDGQDVPSKRASRNIIKTCMTNTRR